MTPDADGWVKLVRTKPVRTETEPVRTEAVPARPEAVRTEAVRIKALRAKLVVGVLLVAFAFYAVTIGWRGVLLVGDGRPAAVALGIGVLLLPLLGAWALWHEVRFGLATQRLAAELETHGALPVDDLPRRPSGRIDRRAADAAFAPYRQDVEQAPLDWAAWYRLATAYDAAGDRRRARSSARRAISLHASSGG